MNNLFEHALLENAQAFDPTRRRFVTGIAAGGALAGLGLSPFNRTLAAQERQLAQQQSMPELSGNTFQLNLGEQRVNFTGKHRIADTINGSVPGPVLRWREGDNVTLKVTNNLPVTSSIHWHGMILPTHMDGVPGLSYNGIKSGETFTYQFKVQQSGTYWYHSHSGYQEQKGMYGSIVIEPKQRDPYQYDRDYVVMLSDWSDENPNRIYAKLKKLSHYYNFNERTTADLFREIKENGVAKTWQSRKMWNQMRMSTRDLSDVTGYTYTYLMNGQTPAEGWKGLFKRGEKIRLRFVNGSAMSFFDIRIPGLKMTVVAADGQNIKPISVDEFRIAVAETYDVIVQPSDDRAYTIFSQSIGRSGYARGTLTPDLSLTADIPKMDAVPNLTHADMGMNMSGMNHGAMGMSGAKGTESAAMSGMDHSKMQGMDLPR
jgi:CopA family copper-resistance protein